MEGRYLDVLAANGMATALSPRVVPGRNRHLDVFLNDAERELYVDWEETTARLVGTFQRAVGVEVNEPRPIEIVGELCIASPRFRELWARRDVRSREGALVELDHPLVGGLRLRQQKLGLAGGSGGLVVAVYHAERGGADADKLALLGSYSFPGAIDPSASDYRVDNRER